MDLKGSEEWVRYSQSGNKPEDIPSNADNFYKGKGWISWGDWLGTGKIANRLREYRDFEEARTFVHSLSLKSRSEWSIYCKIGNKTEDVPTAPSNFYKGKGWISWGDWLGTGTIAGRLKKYRPIKEARLFVHSLNLKSSSEWGVYCKNGLKPEDIPRTPHETYKGIGWVSMGDWLGTGTIANHFRIYKTFEQGRDFVHRLNLISVAAWKEYCKIGNKPGDIPANPYLVYKDKGWVSWKDWLGTS